MVTQKTCPKPETLTAYAGNDLAFDDAVTVEAHFAHCRACLDRFVELGKKSLTPEIPDCHVVKEIGRGRFGVVYKAWRTGAEPHLVALKVLSSPGEMEQNRFDREITVLRRLDSPAIVKCLDSGQAGESRYYVMDLVEGVHLDEYLKSSTANLNEKLLVFERVCRAVAEAHTLGVVHRDLKPRNILIDAAGQPHILDFGICSVDAADWSSWDHYTLTNPGDIIGTLKYMSPEQAWGGAAGAIDHRSDIWSLGVMLHEIVTDGGYPYSLEPAADRPAHEAILERIRKELPALPKLTARSKFHRLKTGATHPGSKTGATPGSEAPSGLPRGRDLEVLLERCLAWDPNRRIDSAGTLADDLHRYVEGQRIRTRPLWIPYRLQRVAVGAAIHARWALLGMFATAAVISLWVGAMAAGVGWHREGDLIGGSGGGASPGGGFVAADVRDGIVIAGVFDDTIDEVVSLASERGIDGVTADVTTWRAVHGQLMNRMVAAAPKALVWDYFFRSEREGDLAFVVGLENLERSGVPVVLAAHRYHEDGSPELSSGIVDRLGDRLRHGLNMARDMVERPGEFITAVRRGKGPVVPGLSVTALGAVMHPGAHIDVDWAPRELSLDLLYEIEPGRYLRDRGRVALTLAVDSKIQRLSVRKGDSLAITTTALQRPQQWEPRTIPYQRLLTCSPDELRELVGDKLVLVGDLRTPQFGSVRDRHRVKFGSTIVPDVPGCYLQADAIAGLMTGHYKQLAIPPSLNFFLLMLGMAILGCALPFKLATFKMLEGPGVRVVLWGVLLFGSAGCVLGMLASHDYLTVHFALAGYLLFVPMTGSFWVEFVRNRHRIAERSRRTNESLSLSAAGTITLPPKRRI